MSSIQFLLLHLLALVFPSLAVFQTTIGEPNEDGIVPVVFANPVLRPSLGGRMSAPPLPNNHFVNLGGLQDYIDSDQETWKADIFTSTGTAVDACSSFPFVGYDRPPVYCVYRVWPGQGDSGSLVLPVSPGEYHLTLYFSETTALPGQRSLNLFAEGFQIFAGLDISQILSSSTLAVPYGMVPVVVQGPITDGALNLLIQAAVGEPTLAAIRLIKLANLTGSPTVSPTTTPTIGPTITATGTPTVAPTTVAPTVAPTIAPTLTPTVAPTVAPTLATTAAPTVPLATVAPTLSPTITATVDPTLAPTLAPTATAPTGGFELRIDAGTGIGFVDVNNKVWQADSYFTGGGIVKNCPIAIANTDLDFMYCSERWGNFRYDIPVPVGKTYRVTVHLAEIFFQNPNQRVFGVTVNNTPLPGIDLVVLAGYRSAYKLETIVADINGMIEITFQKIVQNPKFSGVEIVEVDASVPLPTPSPSTAPAFSPNTSFDLRINCGSFASKADLSGNIWVADGPYANGGGVYSNCGSPITGGESFLYCTERYGTGNPLYNIPVPTPGNYKVVLHFAEIFFNDPGKRVFGAKVNDQTVSNIDLVDAAGPRTAYTIEVIVAGVTSSISVSLVKMLQNPKISGIHVMELDSSFVPPTAAPTIDTGVVALINCGGSAYTDSLGRAWSADDYFTGGSLYAKVGSIANTVDDTIYMSERWGQFTYNIPVSNGSYDITLHFAELFFTSANKRLFNILVEGAIVSAAVDVFVIAGNQNMAAAQLTFTGVVVSDGMLTIGLANSDPKVNNPKLSGIEVFEA